MPGALNTDRPSEAEIRSALARIVSSPHFTSCPQLSGFLTYVVETTLDGKPQQIKGYTIAVEALGRDASFDPNGQSIVRTEAARLRQSLARYYNDRGRFDPIGIDLPRGRYVPEFIYRSNQDALPPASPQEVNTDPERPNSPPAQDALRDSAAGADRKRTWPFTPGTLALIAIVTYIGLEVLVLDDWNIGHRRVNASKDQTKAEVRRYERPRIGVLPPDNQGFEGSPWPGGTIVQSVLTDVLSRFDGVSVVVQTADQKNNAPSVDYLLEPTIVQSANQATLSLRLTDALTRSVLWQKSFELTSESAATVVNRIAAEASRILLQPFGVLTAAERSKLSRNADPTRWCVLDAIETLRYSSPERRERGRKCLEEMVAVSPDSADAHGLLARIYYFDYMYGFSSPDALTRASAHSHRAIELAPTSPRAQYASMNVHIARGELEHGLEHGEKALSLNPYDPRVTMIVGAQLVTVGQLERGRELLVKARSQIDSNPLLLTWSLFLIAYLNDDLPTASMCVDEMPGDHDLEFVARALLSDKMGDAGSARDFLRRLGERRPNWIEQTDQTIARLIADVAIAERLVAAIKRISMSAAQ